MKELKYYFLLVMFLFSLNAGYAQNEPAAPEPPEPPEFEFDFDFKDFPGMSEKDEQELLKNLNKTLREELKVIKDVNLNKYFEFLRESQFKNMKIPFVVKREKVMHEIERKIFEAEVKSEALAAKYEKANENEKRKLKEDLRKELGTLFDQKEERRKQEVEILQNELTELKKSLEARQKNKKVIIDRRLQELLDEDQYLDWD